MMEADKTLVEKLTGSAYVNSPKGRERNQRVHLRD